MCNSKRSWSAIEDVKSSMNVCFSIFLLLLFLPKFLLTYDLITLAVGRENQHERHFSVFFYLFLLKFLTILIDDIITSVVWSEFILQSTVKRVACYSVEYRVYMMNNQIITSMAFDGLMRDNSVSYLENISSGYWNVNVLYILQ